jgi:hypothetical protein
MSESARRRRRGSMLPDVGDLFEAMFPYRDRTRTLTSRCATAC